MHDSYSEHCLTERMAQRANASPALSASSCGQEPGPCCEGGREERQGSEAVVIAPEGSKTGIAATAGLTSTSSPTDAVAGAVALTKSARLADCGAAGV